MVGKVGFFQFKYPEPGAEAGAGSGPTKAHEPEKLRGENQVALKAQPRPEDLMKLMISLRNADTNNKLAKPLMLQAKEQVDDGETESIDFNLIVQRLKDKFSLSSTKAEKILMPELNKIQKIFDTKDAIFDFITDIFSDVIKDRKELSEKVLAPGEFETLIEELVTMEPQHYKVSDLSKSDQKAKNTRRVKDKLKFLPMMKGRSKLLLVATITAIEDSAISVGSQRAQKFATEFRSAYPGVFKDS